MKPEIQEVKQKDYVVANYQDKKALIRVTGVKGSTLKGMWEIKDEEHSVEIDIEDVTANLGRTPLIGKVYGCNTERLIDATTTKPIKTVEWYFNASEDEIEAIHEGILAGAKLLKKHDLHRILKVVTGKVVLNTAKALSAKSMIGSYKVRGASDEKPDIITFKYHKDMLVHMPMLVCHEAGHGIWYRLMSPKLQAKWTALFFRQSEIEHYDAELCDAAIRKAFADKTIFLDSEEHQAAFAKVLANVEAATGLRAKDVWLLLTEDPATAKAVLNPWRKYGYFEGEREVHVSDYANTNVEEMWCEALAHFCTGVSLPAFVSDLFGETIAEVAGQDVNVVED